MLFGEELRVGKIEKQYMGNFQKPDNFPRQEGEKRETLHPPLLSVPVPFLF